MLKKSLFMVIVFLMLFGGTTSVFSESAYDYPLAPGDPIYQAGLALEAAQYELVANLEEKIRMQNEYAERRLDAMEQADDPEDLVILLDSLNEHEQEIEDIIDGLDEFDAEKIFDLVQEANKQKSVRLMEMVEDENLPEEARNGAAQALANQEMAMEKLKGALAKAQQAREAARSQSGQEYDPVPGPPEGVTPGQPDNGQQGPPDDEQQGKPDVKQGPPDDVQQGPPEDLPQGPPQGIPAGGGASGGAGRP